MLRWAVRDVDSGTRWQDAAQNLGRRGVPGWRYAAFAGRSAAPAGLGAQTLAYLPQDDRGFLG
jgi:hypothetical protein